MPKKQVYNVIPHEDGWAVKEGAKLISEVMKTREEAQIHAMCLSNDNPLSQVEIHGKEGKMQIPKYVIAGSGHNTMFKTAKSLRDIEFDQVVISPYYFDPLGERPREIDIVAKTTCKDDDYGHGYIFLDLVFIIECKFIKQTTVFWFGDRDLDKSMKLISKDLGSDNISDPTGHRYYDKDSTGTKIKVAKAFEPLDQFNKAINECLNSYFYDADKHLNRSSKSHGILKYPIIVCDGFENFFGVDLDEPEKNPFPIKENFLLEVNYIYKDKDGREIPKYVLIDVVKRENLEEFVAKVKKNECNWKMKIIAEAKDREQEREQDRLDDLEKNPNPFDVF